MKSKNGTTKKILERGGMNESNPMVVRIARNEDRFVVVSLGERS